MIELNSGQRLEIALLHGVFPPTSLTELLFTQKRKIIQELETPDFKSACRLLKNRFQSQLECMYLDIITSRKPPYFRNYLEANNFKEIYVPADFELNFAGKSSFNILPLFKKCSIPVIPISIYKGEEIHFTNQVSDLFVPKSTKTQFQEL